MNTISSVARQPRELVDNIVGMLILWMEEDKLTTSRYFYLIDMLDEELIKVVQDNSKHITGDSETSWWSTRKSVNEALDKLEPFLYKKILREGSFVGTEWWRISDSMRIHPHFCAGGKYGLVYSSTVKDGEAIRTRFWHNITIKEKE